MSSNRHSHYTHFDSYALDLLIWIPYLKRTQLESTPPRLLDPSIRKGRDDALANLRQAKVELTKAKDESIQLSQKLNVAESLVNQLEREKQLIMNAQSDLKKTFVTNLNSQQEKHEKELLERGERIKELERLLTEKIEKS